MFANRSRRVRRPRPRSVYVPLAEILEARTVPSFLPPVHYPAGTNCNIPNLGDFNGDGALDIAVDNAEGHNVSVFLNNGNGTFGAAVNYAAGQRPYSLSLADINMDTRLDLVTSDFGSATVSVMLGNGDGTFQAPISTPAGPAVEDAKAGDFNGDGLPDLAVPRNSNPGAVLVMLGNGDGSFGTPTSYDIGAGGAFMALGDADGNGILDLLVPSLNTGTVAVLLGNGDGTFQQAQSYPAGASAIMVDVGDFNLDGRLDMAVANAIAGSGSVNVLLGNGDGTFGAPTTYPVGAVAESVAVGDLNVDGIADLIVASDGAGVTVYIGQGDGTFAARQDFAVQDTPAATVGDLNGDGSPDAVAANFRSNTVSVLLSDGSWPGAPVKNFYVYPDTATVTAGAPIDMAVFALNAAFGLVTDYTGEILFVSTDAQAVTPGQYTYRREDTGIALFGGGLTFNTPGIQALLVLDTATFTVFGFAIFDVQAPFAGGGTAPTPMLDAFLAEALSDGRRGRNA